MRGTINTIKLKFDDSVCNELNNKFIALDTETTGLSYYMDSITEIGMVLYENGKITKTYNSLINIKGNVSPYITQLTGITNEMLRSAPSEETVYKEVTDFLSEALNEETIIVAHNASFDMGFIKASLERFGYLGSIRYVDTLQISRSLVKGLPNYKQDTVANYFNLVNKQAHRAFSDASICGEILLRLIEINNNKYKTNFNTKYDSLFDEETINAGTKLFKYNAVNNYEEINNTCNATISSARSYTIELNFNNNELIASCNCPLFNKDKYCKHTYALLLKYTSMNK